MKLDESIPYYGDLHIDEGTKKLILNLLRSIRSVVPVVTPSDAKDPAEGDKYTDPDYISNVLVLARKHSAELEGLFNPDELLRYTRYISHYNEILTELESTLHEIAVCRNSAMKFASGMAEMVEEILMLTTPAKDKPESESSTRRKRENYLFNQNEIKLKVV